MKRISKFICSIIFEPLMFLMASLWLVMGGLIVGVALFSVFTLFVGSLNLLAFCIFFVIGVACVTVAVYDDLGWI